MEIFSILITSLIVVFGTINIIRMVLFLVGSDVYMLHQVLEKKRSLNKEEPFWPTFSVILPAHNEETTIERSIHSVLLSDYPKNKLQVIVMDDGSQDRTLEIAKEYETFGYNFVAHTQTNKGKAHALNNAMRNYATGELIMCLDSDSFLHPDALKNAARHFMDPKVKALSSNVKIRSNGTLLNLIQIFEYLICYQMKRAQTVFNIEYIIGGIGSVFRQSTLEEVGYYDTDTITEDIDLTMKILKRGNKENRVVYGSDVIAYTESVLDISGLIRQRFRWKYGRAQTFVKNLSLFFNRDKKHTKLFTWVYLPYAIFSDIAFFFEPVIIGYITYVIVRYADWLTLISAFAVVSAYIALTILSEVTISRKDRVKYALMAPSMYFFFYLLSFVEYVALIKTYIQIHKIPKSIGNGECGWVHVARGKI
ncbi:MAG: glycosyltransferase [Patescibacteria group bacterium]